MLYPRFIKEFERLVFSYSYQLIRESISFTQLELGRSCWIFQATKEKEGKKPWLSRFD
ncbi:MAG: hypothetical protein UZ08_BCD001001850 [Candidatus Parvibacillus calidus]|jgi:hypothetical protein|nr:MAG: hypothetical protein UZ08_BCD001001850 [Candidatus Parvibacillus calidus]